MRSQRALLAVRLLPLMKRLSGPPPANPSGLPRLTETTGIPLPDLLPQNQPAVSLNGGFVRLRSPSGGGLGCGFRYQRLIWSRPRALVPVLLLTDMQRDRAELSFLCFPFVPGAQASVGWSGGSSSSLS